MEYTNIIGHSRAVSGEEKYLKGLFVQSFPTCHCLIGHFSLSQVSFKFHTKSMGSVCYFNFQRTNRSLDSISTPQKKPGCAFGYKDQQKFMSAA